MIVSKNSSKNFYCVVLSSKVNEKSLENTTFHEKSIESVLIISSLERPGAKVYLLQRGFRSLENKNSDIDVVTQKPSNYFGDRN